MLKFRIYTGITGDINIATCVVTPKKSLFSLIFLCSILVLTDFLSLHGFFIQHFAFIIHKLQFSISHL